MKPFTFFILMMMALLQGCDDDRSAQATPDETKNVSATPQRFSDATRKGL